MGGGAQRRCSWLCSSSISGMRNRTRGKEFRCWRRRKREWEARVLALDFDAVGAADFHHPEAVFCPDLAENVMNVIFHGLFGKVQVRGNLFVGEAAGNQRQQLLFPPGESYLVAHS